MGWKATLGSVSQRKLQPKQADIQMVHHKLQIEDP
jgi:hypothetical protein